MSDIVPGPFDATIEILRERERDLDIQAQSLVLRRDEVREMIALLTSRKPRAARKPRAVSEAAAPATEGATPFPFAPAFAREPAEEAA